MNSTETCRHANPWYMWHLSVNFFLGCSMFIRKYLHPQQKKKKKKNKDSRDKAKIDFASLLKNHQNNPSVVVGNFNMTKQQLKILILEFLINGLL